MDSIYNERYLSIIQLMTILKFKTINLGDTHRLKIKQTVPRKIGYFYVYFRRLKLLIMISHHNSSNNPSKIYRGCISHEEWESYIANISSTDMERNIIPEGMVKVPEAYVDAVAKYMKFPLPDEPIRGIVAPINILDAVKKLNPELSADVHIGSSGILYCLASRDEWKNQIRDILPTELKAILKFLKLSPQLSIDNFINLMAANLPNEEDTCKIWEKVSTPEEFVQATLMYLSGKLCHTIGHGEPLWGESFIVLSELYELTKLGCPTVGSQPFRKFEVEGGTCFQIARVSFLCPNKIVHHISQILIKTCHISVTAGNKHTIYMVSPSAKVTDYIPLRLVVLKNEKVMCDQIWNITTGHRHIMELQILGCKSACEEKMFNTYSHVTVYGTSISNKLFTDVIAAVKSAQAQV